MHFADNRNRLPLNPVQLKQYRKLFEWLLADITRADAASSRAISGRITLKPVYRGLDRRRSTLLTFFFF